MKKGTGFLIELEVVHPCVNIEALDKVKDKDAQIVMKGITKMDKRGVSHLFTLKSSKPNELLEAHKKHKNTRDIKVISKSENRIDFILESKPDIGIAHALAKSRCISLEPVITENEVDRILLFAPNWTAFKEFVNGLPEDFEYKIKKKRAIEEGTEAGISSFQSVGFLELKTVAEMLTLKQLEILNSAIVKGYYASPRRITMNELAEYLGISTPTLHEHLSKIEAKVMPVLHKIMRWVK